MFSIVIFLSRLDLAGNDVVSLSANHLQKLRFSFQLTTPHGHAFKPHQVCSSCLRPSKWMPFQRSIYWSILLLQAFFKLRHETKHEHIFVVGNTGKKFEIILVKYLLLLISLSRFRCSFWLLIKFVIICQGPIICLRAWLHIILNVWIHMLFLVNCTVTHLQKGSICLLFLNYMQLYCKLSIWPSLTAFELDWDWEACNFEWPVCFCEGCNCHFIVAILVLLIFCNFGS